MSRVAEYDGTIVNYKDQFQATKKLKASLDSRDHEIAALGELIKGKDIRIATLEAQNFEMKEEVKRLRGRAASLRADLHELKQSGVE
jgi:predicted nuclease with TOPRIM domain